MSTPTPYTGRFAPSPTGPLHYGSLLAAVASYLEARCHHGRWLLRIEDIDPPREQSGASESIVGALATYGFEWDGPVVYQSRSEADHTAAVQYLLDQGMAYRCTCSRRDLSGEPRTSLGIVYPGNCRTRRIATNDDCAIRIRTNDEAVNFEDALQGPQSQALESSSGDYVIRRKDGLIAYQLAVVVDDHLQGITHIVRGIDLMDSTPRQIWLQRCLGYRTPAYAHIPVAVHADGSKLSKLTGATAIPLDQPAATLLRALTDLRQAPPDSLHGASLGHVWEWAIEHWDASHLRGLESIPGH